MPVNVDIPYRCPNCGDQMKFTTLHELRCHLENEHSYRTSRSRRRVNISDFDGAGTYSSSMSDLSRISPLTQRFHEDTLMLEEEVRKHKEEELNNKRHRAGSMESLLDREDGHSHKIDRRIRDRPSSKVSFRDYSLSSRLTRHLNPPQRSRKHTNREHSSRRQMMQSAHGEDDMLDDSNPQEYIDENILDRISHKMRDTAELRPSANMVDSKHVSQSLQALSKEVMIERASQQATAESLYSANETLFGVEKAAEERIALQQRVIDNLAEELKDKERRLSSMMEEMDNLREQQAALKNAHVINTNIDFESKYLRQELAEKQRELDALTKNVERSKQLASVENLKDQIPEKLSHVENTVRKSPVPEDNRNKLSYPPKDNLSFTVFHASESKEATTSADQTVSPENTNEDELKSVKSKAQQLEKDRHSLLLEMQGLLESAAVDNEKLRQELHNQEKKMSRMNLDLKSSKHEQAELLGETHELYHQADVGLTKLKMMLKERDRQLSGISSALEQAKDIQERLVSERDDSLKQAAEREGMYRAMLTANSDQLKTMKEALAANQDSKHALERNLRKLNHQLESKGMEDLQMKQRVENLARELKRREEKESKLKNEVQRREEKLRKAKSEMERMTDFLRKTSDKETSARMKLEGFISKLLERAEKAESELKELQGEKVKKTKYPKKRSSAPDKSHDRSHTKHDKTHEKPRNVYDKSSYDKASDGLYDKSDDRSSDRLYERPYVRSSDNPHDSPYDRPPDKPYESPYGRPPERPHDRSLYKKPHERPFDMQFEEPIRDEDAAMNFALLPQSDLRQNSQFPSDAGMIAQFPSDTGVIASYPPESDLGTRPTFATVPSSLLPQNPFYLHRPRRQTYNNAASMYSTPAVPAYEYDAAVPRMGQEHVFQNTPELNDMIRNVQRQNYLSSYNPVSLKDVEPSKSAPGIKKSSQLSSRGKLDFSIDDDGIMWERHATPSPHHSSRYLPDSSRKLLAPHPDDTDVGEVSDFVFEEEQKSHEESEDPDILTSSSKAKQRGKGKFNQVQNEGVPHGGESEKLFLVSEPYALSSGENDIGGKKDHTDEVEIEASDVSPLNRAKEVQKRVEEWTTSKNAESPLFSSRGFDAEHIGADSDFSTSSYTSIKRTREPSSRDTNQVSRNEFTHEVDVEPIRSSKHGDTFSAKPTVTSVNNNDRTQAPKPDELEQPPVEEELVSAASRSDQTFHKFAGRMLNKPTSTPKKQQNDNAHVDNDMSERSEFSRRTNSLPVKKAEEEKTLLSEAEIELQKRNEGEKIPSRRQISIISGSSMEELDEIGTEPELMPGAQIEETFTQDVEETAQESPVQHSRNNGATHDAQQPDDMLKPDSIAQAESGQTLKLPDRAESPSLISQASEAVNAEFVTENDSADEYAAENEHLYGNQSLAREEGDATYHSYGEMSSSEDDLPDGGKGDYSRPEANDLAVTSVDASTDTDLEKLSQPGHVHRGLAVGKKKPLVKYVRKKQKKLARHDPAQQSASSADELDSSAMSKKKASKNVRVALFHIFSYLDTNELLKVALVSKQWCKISRHPALWKNVSLHNRSISSEFLITLSQWCTKTESLSLRGLRGRGIQPDEDVDEYKAALRGSLEQGLEKILQACQDTITCLDIKDCDNILTDKCIWLVSGYCRLLTRLTYNSSLDPIHSQLMWALGGGCPGVTSLFVQPQHPCSKSGCMNNRCLLMISQFYRDLEEIGVGGKDFDVGGLVPLVQACQHLRHLRLEYCLPVTADLATGLCRAGLKQLQTVAITGAPVEVKAIQALQSNCRQLKTINIMLSPQDCVDNPTNKKDKEKYKKMVKALEGLKSKAAFAKILFVDAAPVD